MQTATMEMMNDEGGMMNIKEAFDLVCSRYLEALGILGDRYKHPFAVAYVSELNEIRGKLTQGFTLTCGCRVEPGEGGDAIIILCCMQHKEEPGGWKGLLAEPGTTVQGM